ncbi:hypothetical protein ACF0H5_016543 [Mactra antiquata]
MDEMFNVVSGIQEDRRKILYHLNKLADGSPQCTCKEQLEHCQKEILELQTRVGTLEQGNTKTDSTLEKVNSDIKTLKYELEEIQRKLQTDYVKLSTGIVAKHKTDADHLAETKSDKSDTRFAVASVNDRHMLQENSDDEDVFCNNLDCNSDSSLSPTDENRIIQNDAIGSNSTPGSKIESNSTRSETEVTMTRDLPESTRQTKVDIIKQDAIMVSDGIGYWGRVADRELEISRAQFNGLICVTTVLCIDVSESMLQNDGWQQILTFVTEYLKGLSLHVRREYVAMVTFGHETVVKQRLTNNYELLLEILKNLKISGSSSLFGGLCLSLSSTSCTSCPAFHCLSGLIIPAKLIILTDGRPTDTNVIAGSESISATQKTREDIWFLLQTYVYKRTDVFVVPVGDADMDFIDYMVETSEGFKLDHTSGHRLARRTHLAMEGSNAVASAEDLADLASLTKRTEWLKGETIPVLGSDEFLYYERVRSQLPQIGSRVCRGPDWIFNEQDNSGPGTVIGHLKDVDMIWVQWDKNDGQYKYRYGEIGFDVLLIDEPRKLYKDRILAVGCNVKPGKNWNKTHTKHKRGVVIKLDNISSKATVRWDTGHRGEYSADVTAGELEYCPNIERYSEDSGQHMSKHTSKAKSRNFAEHD